MYELLGISISLAALLVFHSLLSFLSMLAWRVLRSRVGRWPAAGRARALFALRVLPGLSAVLFVGIVLLPAYIAFEPRHQAEAVSLRLGLLAALSALGLLLAFIRGTGAIVATRRLARQWMSHARPIRLPGIGIESFRLDHPFPLIAVVGTLRPRLFIAEMLFAELSEAELSAAIAHESCHLAARDNLKRAVLRFCRDVLVIVPFGRSLDDDWIEAAELAADESAARLGRPVALDLASALVKIARLVAPGARPAVPAGAHLIGENPGGIAARVSRLLDLASSSTGQQAAGTAATTMLPVLGLTIGGPLFIAFVMTLFSSLREVHSLIEFAVSSLK